jgi:tRNA(fMet)-specific endonuclease VapC
MMYLLDTNSCIRYLGGRSEPLRRRINRADPDEMVVCSVVKAELFFGAMKSKNPAKTLKEQKDFLDPFNSLTFDDQAAEAYGPIRADLERRGLPIGSNDMMIAAIAMANDLTLVTHNTAEFARIPGLRVEDWEDPD